MEEAKKTKLSVIVSLANRIMEYEPNKKGTKIDVIISWVIFVIACVTLKVPVLAIFILYYLLRSVFELVVKLTVPKTPDYVRWTWTWKRDKINIIKYWGYIIVSCLMLTVMIGLPIMACLWTPLNHLFHSSAPVVAFLVAIVYLYKTLVAWNIHTLEIYSVIFLYALVWFFYIRRLIKRTR